MAITPEGMMEMTAEITSVKGSCGAGHSLGETFRLSCWNPGGLCGYFYHDIFPYLSAMQFGGEIPWAGEKGLTLECPDRHNTVTIILRKPR